MLTARRLSLVLPIRCSQCRVSFKQVLPGSSNCRGTSGEFPCLFLSHWILAQSDRLPPSCPHLQPEDGGGDSLPTAPSGDAIEVPRYLGARLDVPGIEFTAEVLPQRLWGDANYDGYVRLRHPAARHRFDRLSLRLG